MEEVNFQRGVVIGMHLISLLKDRGGEFVSATDIGENKSVFATCFNGNFQMYINPRILNDSKSLTLEYTDEYGNFNIKEYHENEAKYIRKMVD